MYAPSLIDVRTLAEFRGEHFFDAPPQPGQTTGHIPGARHLPHTALLRVDGTYRPADELRVLCDQQGLTASREAIPYCAVGIRSALAWFALKHLLGFPHVRSYDGSWNEGSRAKTTGAGNRAEEGL